MAVKNKVYSNGIHTVDARVYARNRHLNFECSKATELKSTDILLRAFMLRRRLAPCAAFAARRRLSLACCFAGAIFIYWIVLVFRSGGGDDDDGSEQWRRVSVMDVRAHAARLDAVAPDAASRRAVVVDAIRHAWKGYATHALGRDELRPLTRRGSDKWGRLQWTLVDALDTLQLAGLRSELAQARAQLARSSFAQPWKTVSVFEACIRLLGGTLAAFELTGDALYLDKAADVGERLLVAFSTPSGLPVKRVSMVFGAPAWLRAYQPKPLLNTLVSMGTLQLEFAHLSRLRGDPRFEAAARRAVSAMAIPPSGEAGEPVVVHGMFPFDYNVETGAPLSRGGFKSIGSGTDSFYEYLIKVYILGDGRDTQLLDLWTSAMDEMLVLLVRNFTLASGEQAHILSRRWGGDDTSSISRHMEQMECFVPGMLALGVDYGRRKAIASLQSRHGEYMRVARGLMRTCVAMWDMHASGLAAESYTYDDRDSQAGLRAAGGDTEYLLRPETLESLFVLWRVTGETAFRDAGWRLFRAIETHCRTEVAYAAVRDVTAPVAALEHADSMESFLLAETFKYALLLFSDVEVLSLHDWVFSTEAHAFRIHKQGGAGVDVEARAQATGR